MSREIDCTQPQHRLGSEAELNPADWCAVAGGSQSTGAGAGRVTFNPFPIMHKLDQSSPMFWIG